MTTSLERHITDDILIVGAGIGGLTLALELHARGLPCRVFEAAPVIQALGMGINIQPYATAIFARLGILDELASVAVATREFVFFNRYGQQIHAMGAGKFAGNPYPQLSIHRGDLHMTLLNAVVTRLGADRVHAGFTCTGVEQSGRDVTLRFNDSVSGKPLASRVGAAAVAADGIHSVICKTLFPAAPPLRYSGTNMWRGTSLWPDFLSGASMVRIGLPEHGKLVLYPIRRNVGGSVRNLVNWVVELDTPDYNRAATNEPASTADFMATFKHWTFDWLDIPGLLTQTVGPVMKFPMMDRDPLEQWRVGRVTLLGDAAHPMVPLGSNGAGQAILDAHSLAAALAAGGTVEQAFEQYEDERRPYTANIVLADRAGVVDAMVKEVEVRTQGLPFGDLHEVISAAELESLSIPDYRQRTAAGQVPLAAAGARIT
jgi:2-polyprenyl-6-methoxyphenol hydroxylase-like FAD-dependent oxidoreductase